jgi:hypothetical protein
MRGSLASRSPPQSRSDVDVGRVDQLDQGRGIHFATRPQLHMAPALACSLDQASRVLQQRTKEEADVDVIPERIDVTKRGVVDAGGRTSVVHQLPHVAATLPHAQEPGFCERPQISPLRTQPDIDRGVAFHRRRKAKNVVHRLLNRA